MRVRSVWISGVRWTGLVSSWLALAAFVVPTSAARQAAPTPAFETAGAFVALSVADLDATARWYSEKFGMRVIFDSPPSNGFSVKALEGGGLLVELIHNQAAVPLGTAAPAITHTTQVHGIVKAGFVVTDYERTLATLRERGVPVVLGPFPARNGQRANFIIRDNAGNMLQIFGR